jgi:hypothetical protein
MLHCYLIFLMIQHRIRKYLEQNCRHWRLLVDYEQWILLCVGAYSIYIRGTATFHLQEAGGISIKSLRKCRKSAYLNNSYLPFFLSVYKPMA